MAKVSHPEPAQLRIASPVLLLAGPSGVSNELSQRLRAMDVKVLTAPSADTAETLAAEESVDLVVADARAARRLSDLQDALAKLRQLRENLVVLFWCDATAEDTEILALCQPQDDHIVGSVSLRESLRRLHLLTGRLPERGDGEQLVVGDLRMDTTRRTVVRGDKDIDLSDTEFRLLRLLMRHARTVLPKPEILQQVWEYDFAGQANIVELYISYLRKKIDASMPRMIHTVRGAGYVLRPAPQTQDENEGEGSGAESSVA